MSDALKKLAQVSNQAAQAATSNLQNLTDQQEEMLKQKENVRGIQSKISPKAVDTFAKSNLKGIAAVKDEFETKKHDPFNLTGGNIQPAPQGISPDEILNSLPDKQTTSPRSADLHQQMNSSIQRELMKNRRAWSGNVLNATQEAKQAVSNEGNEETIDTDTLDYAMGGATGYENVMSWFPGRPDGMNSDGSWKKK